MLPDTRSALGDHAAKCENRSLFQDRFADPQATDKSTPSRTEWFQSLQSPRARKASGPPPSLDWLPGNASVLYARAEGRVMLNMAGGVMTNAGLCLDRRGWPVIPGSAVKGCARRMALLALREWTEAGAPAPDSVGAAGREAFRSRAEMLSAIAQVFGWVEQDWRAGRNRDGLFLSDFGWACGDDHESVWADACAALAEHLGWHPDTNRPWTRFPNHAGSIAFLPAHPNRDPGLELDVLTPHHKKYYSGELASATDTEDPVPVFFPAIAPQHGQDHFAFALVPLRAANPKMLEFAKTWLLQGLQIIGLGAKTNAGYGWFADVTRETEERAKLEQERRTKEDVARRKREQTEAKQRVESARKAELDALPKDQKEDRLLAQLATDWSRLKPHLTAFAKHPREKQAAMLRWLASPAGESRWTEIKVEGAKGKKPWSQILGDIHQVRKALNLKLP